MKVPGAQYANLPPITMYLKIKTRVRPNTIADAEAALAATDNQQIVVCEYKDNVFNTTVPYSNMVQFIYRDWVTGLD